MFILTQPYRKMFVLVTVSLLVFTGVYADQDDSPLAAMLATAASRPAFPQMTANVVSYIDYRALEAAAGLEPITSRAAYDALDETNHADWETAYLRAYAGPPGFVNLADTRIEQMPDLLGFGFFDVDAALTYGSDPFTATLLHSASGGFSSLETGRALSRRGYEIRITAAGGAWGLGGDGMTDINNMEMGDPFGGDVGLSSRVQVLDPHTVVNAFLWGIVFVAAEGHTGDAPTYGQDPAYAAMTDALNAGEASLIQAVMVSPLAGETFMPNDDVPPPPRYELAAIADLQDGADQLHRVVLLYDDEADARAAAAALPAALREFDSGWLETIGFEVGEPSVVQRGGYYQVLLDLRAPALSPVAVREGAFQPGLVFGFWANAVRGGTFFPFALSPPSD